jgi:hypothetical protein
MPEVGFEPTIQVFERESTLHSLDRAATVIGISPKCEEFTLSEIT